MAKNENPVSNSDTKTTVAQTPTTQTPIPQKATTPPPPKARYEGVTTFVYVGPTLPGGRLGSNKVLSGSYDEITAYYKDVIADFPDVAKLIVPVAQLADYRDKVGKRGNGIFNRYQKVVGEMNAKMKAMGVER